MFLKRIHWDQYTNIIIINKQKIGDSEICTRAIAIKRERKHAFLKLYIYYTFFSKFSFQNRLSYLPLLGAFMDRMPSTPFKSSCRSTRPIPLNETYMLSTRTLVAVQLNVFLVNMVSICWATNPRSKQMFSDIQSQEKDMQHARRLRLHLHFVFLAKLNSE